MCAWEAHAFHSVCLSQAEGLSMSHLFWIEQPVLRLLQAGRWDLERRNDVSPEKRCS